MIKQVAPVIDMLYKQADRQKRDLEILSEQ